MLINVVNLTAGEIDDADLLHAIRAVNRQLAEDVEPIWHTYMRLRLEPAITKRPDVGRLAELRGDGIIWVWNHSDDPGAEGDHDLSPAGVPIGHVFLNVCRECGDAWTAGLSHEAIEFHDWQCNLLVPGPGLFGKRYHFLYPFELCDAVEDDQYWLDGVRVSNFVTPDYFRLGAPAGARTDFLGTRNADARGPQRAPLVPFGLRPGGYTTALQPREGRWHQVVMEEDPRAGRRMQAKAMAGKFGRRGKYHCWSNDSAAAEPQLAYRRRPAEAT